MLKRILNYWQRCSLHTAANQMAYDPGMPGAYCASRPEEIPVTRVADHSLMPLGRVPDRTGMGSITIAPKPRTIWMACHKGDKWFTPPDTPSN